ncbi:MAG: sulfotransferase family 2 domain-containing protein [Desulfobacteraceae bacterium]|jgi:hypothetical protein|nr:sulfotransferase family 2 domain-containing protein [Desulfobacteraceae bacterium]
MLISHKKKFIFIHIYKTAGTSVMDVFLPYARLIDRLVYEFKYTSKAVSVLNNIMGWWDHGNREFTGFQKHAPAIDIKKSMGGRFDDYFTFAFVRNPYDWLVSLYFYIRQAKEHPMSDKLNSMNFKAFIRWYLTQAPSRQVDFVTDENRNVIVNYVAKFESLANDIENICRCVSITVSSVGHKNLSVQRDHKDYRKYYDDSICAEVASYFKEDLALFGYDFDRYSTFDNKNSSSSLSTQGHKS